MHSNKGEPSKILYLRKPKAEQSSKYSHFLSIAKQIIQDNAQPQETKDSLRTQQIEGSGNIQVHSLTVSTQIIKGDNNVQLSSANDCVRRMERIESMLKKANMTSTLLV